MAFDKRQYEDRRKELQKQAAARDPGTPHRRFQEEILRQSAVKSELLVQDPNWHIYLTRIQTFVEGAELMRDKARENLEDPVVLDHNKLLQAKVVLLEAEAMIKAFNIAIELPSAIINAQETKENQEET